jgi:siroheme synthase-like protein
VGWLSVNIDFSNRGVLLVGAGRVGLRKLEDLLAAEAKVTVVEPKADPHVLNLAERGAIELVPEFGEALLDSNPWVFVAIDDADKAGEIAALAKARGLMVNVADRLPDCGFIMPALVDDPPFRLAVSTGGHSPALSARVARDLRRQFAGYGALARLLGRIRPLVLDSGLELPERKRIFASLADDLGLVVCLGRRDLKGLKEAVARHLGTVAVPKDFLWLD